MWATWWSITCRYQSRARRAANSAPTHTMVILRRTCRPVSNVTIGTRSTSAASAKSYRGTASLGYRDRRGAPRRQEPSRLLGDPPTLERAQGSPAMSAVATIWDRWLSRVADVTPGGWLPDAPSCPPVLAALPGS